MKHSPCSSRIIFYSLWLVLSVIQASFTELSHDEAYYWLYSTQLAWGYFDHPPMIALLVKMGYLLIPNELGVRLFIIIMNTATIFLIEKIVQPQNLKLFYAIIASIVLIHYGSILAIPDNPLLFFSALFFYFYKKYSEKPAAKLMLLLGVVAALMILSKYLAFLVLFFTFLSNPKVLLKPYTWLAGIISLTILSPHIYWLYLHDFPSIKYQLFARSATVFDITYTLEYLITQPLIYGPIIGFVLLYVAFGNKQTNQFEKTMQYNFLGIFILFFIFTFKGKVEAHWTDSALIPLIFLSYNGIQNTKKLRQFAFYTLPVSLAIILFARLMLMVDFYSEKIPLTREFHGWKNWTNEIKNLAGNRIVVFDNSYQNASKYAFYSQSESASRADMRGRKNQFEIWKSEDKLQNKPAMVISNFKGPGIETLKNSPFPTHYYFVENYSTYPEITVQAKTENIKVNYGEDFLIKINLIAENEF
ncbi:MAG TPA: glycosyltransferase family 39 protein, partial [Bacteroidales bacterium]